MPSKKKPLYGKSPAMKVLPLLKKYNKLDQETRVKLSADFIVNNIAATLEERNTAHGEFTSNAQIAQELKAVLHSYKKDAHTLVHIEALEMILVKVARILNGDPNHADHWHDIAGYATLAEKRCK